MGQNEENTQFDPEQQIYSEQRGGSQQNQPGGYQQNQPGGYQQNEQTGYQQGYQQNYQQGGYQQGGYQQGGYQQGGYQQGGYQPGGYQPGGYQPGPVPNTPYKPESGLVWGILTTLFCCLPFGIVSIVYASKVDSLWYMGNYEGAMDSARKAKNWAMWAAIIGGVFLVAYIVAIVVFGVGVGAAYNNHLFD